jgi:dinuclear metal center YbgI/SA1388 family protein
VGSHSQVVSKILFALDATLEAVRDASQLGAQMLITHHPLLYKPMTRLDWNVHPGNVIAEAVRRGVVVACAHTNLDASKGGINDILSDLLGLQHVKPIAESQAGEDTGLGRVGELREPTSLRELKTRIGEIFGTEEIRLVGEGDREIRTVAVVGGAGGSLLLQAFEKGADVLVTGDVTYHHALEAKSLGIAVLDAGHFYTERTAFLIFAGRFGSAASAKGWNVTIAWKEDELDPVAPGPADG